MLFVLWPGAAAQATVQGRAPVGEGVRATMAPLRMRGAPWLKPVKWLYGLTEKTFGAMGLADNVVVVLRKT